MALAVERDRRGSGSLAEARNALRELVFVTDLERLVKCVGDTVLRLGLKRHGAAPGAVQLRAAIVHRTLPLQFAHTYSAACGVGLAWQRTFASVADAVAVLDDHLLPVLVEWVGRANDAIRARCGGGGSAPSLTLLPIPTSVSEFLTQCGGGGDDVSNTTPAIRQLQDTCDSVINEAFSPMAHAVATEAWLAEAGGMRGVGYTAAVQRHVEAAVTQPLPGTAVSYLHSVSDALARASWKVFSKLQHALGELLVQRRTRVVASLQSAVTSCCRRSGVVDSHAIADGRGWAQLRELLGAAERDDVLRRLLRDVV